MSERKTPKLAYLCMQDYNDHVVPVAHIPLHGLPGEFLVFDVRAVGRGAGHSPNHGAVQTASQQRQGTTAVVAVGGALAQIPGNAAQMGLTVRLQGLLLLLLVMRKMMVLLVLVLVLQLVVCMAAKLVLMMWWTGRQQHAVAPTSGRAGVVQGRAGGSLSVGTGHTTAGAQAKVWHSCRFALEDVSALERRSRGASGIEGL